MNTDTSLISLKTDKIKDTKQFRNYINPTDNFASNREDLTHQKQPFTPTPTPDEIIKACNEDLSELQSQEGGGFPIEAMPPKLQEIIKDVSNSYGFHQDFISCSFLSAFSAAIGSTYRLKIKGSWIESAILFMVLVGNRGKNKSAPVKYAYKPLEKRDVADFETFKQEMAEYKQLQSAKSAENAESAKQEKPKRKQLIISDSTLEAMCYSLSMNRRGLSLVMDELVGFFKNLNRYNKGSDQETYLQIWSNGTVSINRKNDDGILLDNPFLSMIGTIQPGILEAVFKDGRDENGFTDRLLFCYPDIKTMPAFHWNEPTNHSMNNYSNIIERLLALELKDGEPNVITLSNESKHIYQEWVNQQRLIIDENNNEKLSGMFAKFEVYVFRFALIYQLLSWACNEGDREQVEKSAMISAIETVEYFKTTALKVNPIDQQLKIPMDQQRLNVYKQLPKEFTTGQGVEISEKYEMTERKFKAWLNDETSFKKLRHGVYEKTL